MKFDTALEIVVDLAAQNRLEPKDVMGDLALKKEMCDQAEAIGTVRWHIAHLNQMAEMTSPVRDFFKAFFEGVK